MRHLRASQIHHQLKKRFLPTRQVPPFSLLWMPSRTSLGRPKNMERVFFDGKDSFRFNNESRRFAGNWNDPSARKLWSYNLHYMAWIFDLAEIADRERWIKKWVRDNPMNAGGNGWEPYPLSLRIFAWCKHYSLAGTGPDAEVLASLGVQVSRLYADLEFHLDGNHLLENLLAMAFAGFYLDTRDAAALRARKNVQVLLERSLSEQFLADGGHYELSPMYHAILLERILDLIAFWPAQEDPFPGLRDRLQAVAMRGLDWLDTMTVAGRFALFNDSAYDTAPDASMLLDYGNRLLSRKPRVDEPLTSLADSGYFRAVAGPATLIFDGGKLGPDHQMGHAQGDMLSFCLWLGNVPVIVHPGNFEYVPGPMRDYCRSTASHNTLVMEGGEQAEWWASHRVGWRGGPRDVAAAQDASSGAIRMQGSHDGFRRLPGGPIHKREIELTERSLVIRDTVSAGSGTSRIYFHFHPDCILERHESKIRIQSTGGSLYLEADHPMKIEEAWYCPEFGLRFKNQAVIVEGASREFRCIFKFEPG